VNSFIHHWTNVHGVPAKKPGTVLDANNESNAYLDGTYILFSEITKTGAKIK
jgi:hypothetical protein